MAQSQSIADLLAKELGYKNKKELKETLERRGDGFAGGVKGRLEEGLGFREAFAGSTKEQVIGLKESFSKQGLKKLGRKTYRTAFSGDDIFSSYMRGRLRKKEKKELEEKGIEEGAPTKVGADSSVFIKIIAKESMAIPAMARDTNVLRQNLQKLVKLWGGEAATKKEVDGVKEKKLSVAREGEEERLKDVSYFAEQDKKEAELEASRQTPAGKSAITPTPEKKDGEGGFLDSIMSMFANGFMSGIKKLFSPKILGQVLKKVFLPIAIIGTLFSGITAGFKKYQETGSFSEAIISGLGGMLEFLTFGLFGEDTLKNVWSAVSDFLSPITDTISNIFTGIKDFFKKIFGMGGEEDKGKDKIPEVKPQQPDAKSFAQTAAKAAGETDQKAADLGGLFGAVQSGDMKGLFGKAQEMASKYPSQAPAEGSPTPMTGEGVPLDQAQRNYELNKKLTGEASKSLGTSLPFNTPAPTAAPTPAPMATPSAAAKSPTPAPGEDPEIAKLEGQITDLETDIRNGKQMIERRKKQMARPGITEEAKQTYEQANAASAQGVAENEAELEQLKKQLAEKKKAKGGVSAAAVPAAATAPSAGGGGGGSVSAAGGGAAPGGVAGGDSAPSMESSGGPPVSGSEVDSASTAVAEGQRMESAADMGSVVNAPTTNNSSSTQGKAKPPTAEAYDSDLAKMLMTT